MFGVILGGVFAGLALGMLGAGGTIIGLPLFLYLGGPQGHAAFGTNALGVTIITLLLLFWRIRRREVDLPLGIVFAIPGLAGIAIGARLGLLYPATKLIFLLSFLILIVAAWIGYLSTRPATPVPGRATGIEMRQVVRIIPTAFVVGLISGFFAVGGGFLVVPGLAIAAAIDLRSSARSSLVPIAAFAGLDAIEYVLAGDVKFALSGVMIVAGLAGGAAGIVLADRLRLQTVQRIFAVFLGIVAAYMIGQQF
ncbi:MAG: sulfite exporter TauE/SafE family protein [Xanthobacteraceae bacterium]